MYSPSLWLCEQPNVLTHTACVPGMLEDGGGGGTAVVARLSCRPTCVCGSVGSGVWGRCAV
jgi:hypothetical protein